MVRWAAVAALNFAFIVCTVTFVVMDNGEVQAIRSVGGWVRVVGGGVSNRDDLPAKSSKAFRCLGEHIIVLAPPHEVEKFTIVLNVDNVLYRYGLTNFRRSHSPLLLEFWPKITSTNVRGGVTEVKTIGERSVSKFAVRVNPHVSGWCIPRISPHRPEPLTCHRSFIQQLLESPAVVCPVGWGMQQAGMRSPAGA